MLRNFLAWRGKKKKAGRPQGSSLLFILSLWVAAFFLTPQQFMWEGKEVTVAEKHNRNWKQEPAYWGMVTSKSARSW